MSTNESAPALIDEQCVSVAEAAVIAGRSRNWIYAQIVSRRLRLADEASTKPTRVCMASLLRLIEKRRRPSEPPAPYLRLIIDNTK